MGQGTSKVTNFGYVAAVDKDGNVITPAQTSGSQPSANSQSVTPASDATFTVKPASYAPLGYQQLLDATLATSTALAVPTNTTVAVIQNLSTTQGVRWRNDGSTTAPTASTGQRIAPGGTLTLDIGNSALNAVRLIREGALGANVEVQYYS